MSNQKELRFEFGKNWQSFLAHHMDENRLAVSMQHMLDFTGLDSLHGLRMLDIGSGSGLHSLAAIKAGAKEVVSFDYDQHSVLATQQLWKQAGSPPNWHICQGSVLDEDFIRNLGTFDIVYCWGVLHHTGQMGLALTTSLQTVAPNGLYYFALYDSDWSPEPPEFWLDLKQKYVQSGVIKRRLYDLWYIWRFYLKKNLLNLPDFLHKKREYNKQRGMDIVHDIRDWMGGWPMEYSRFTDILQLLDANGFEYKKSKMGQIVTEYLFKKKEDVLAENIKRIPNLKVRSLRTKADLCTISKNLPIYIYGAGKGGQIVYNALKTQGYHVEAFISATSTQADIPVVETTYLDSIEPESVTVILASGSFDAMSMRLLSAGFNSWFNAYPYILSTIAGYRP